MSKPLKNQSILDFLIQHQGNISNIAQFLYDNNLTYRNFFPTKDYKLSKIDTNITNRWKNDGYVPASKKIVGGSFSNSFSDSFDN